MSLNASHHKSSREGRLNAIGRQRLRKQQESYLLLLRVINAFLVSLPFFLAWYLYYANRIATPFYHRGNLLVLALYFVLFNIIGRVYDAFDLITQSPAEMLYSKSITLIVCDGLFYVVISLLSRHLVSVWPMLLMFITQLVVAGVTAHGAHRLFYGRFPAERTIVVYNETASLAHLINAYGLTRKYAVIENIQVDEALRDLSQLDRASTVFFSGGKATARNDIMKYCMNHSIAFYALPKISDAILTGAETRHLFHLPMLYVTRSIATPEYRFMKRALDIVVSLLGLILISPILLVTALAIKLDDRGPVFYTQDRLTREGRVFKIWKFRSMRTDAEKDNVARLSSGEDDPRITKVGRWIRRTRIDELPQLFCILKGDMSLVGPRPERPEIAVQYEEKIPEFALRLQAKAGLTGYAQVYGKYNTSPYDKLIMDLIYIAHPSLLEDLRILFATFKVIFMSESTEGVAADAVTALDADYPHSEE